MPVALTNISTITPATSPLEINGSIDIVGTAPAPQFLINGVPIGQGTLIDPLTTLGDIIVRSATAPARLPVGTNGQVIEADSTATYGVHWATLSFDATEIDLNPAIGTYTTVQQIVTALNTGSPASVLTTFGVLLVRGAAAPVRLAVGTNGQVLEADSTAANGVHWVTIDASTLDLNPPGATWTTIQDAIEGLEAAAVPTPPAGSVGQVQFNAGGTPNVFGASANLFWDTANFRLGIGTAAPGYPLHVLGDLNIQGTAPAPAYRINGIPLANANVNGTEINLTNIATINGAAPGAIPLTTKGDIVGLSTVAARIPVGADDQVLIADD